VTSFPAALAARGKPGGTIALLPIAADLGATYGPRYAVNFGFHDEAGLLYGDVQALAARGVNVDSLESALAKEVAGLPGVERAYTPRSLAAAGPTDLPAARWRRALPPAFGWLVAGVAKDGWQWYDGHGSTEHGTTSLDDSRVPIAFWGAGVRAARPARVARTVDIGPTLAALLGIAPTEPVEGAPLREVTGR
jgi:hypothetical protein